MNGTEVHSGNSGFDSSAKPQWPSSRGLSTSPAMSIAPSEVTTARCAKFGLGQLPDASVQRNATFAVSPTFRFGGEQLAMRAPLAVSVHTDVAPLAHT